jgi:hypothetical protein
MFISHATGDDGVAGQVHRWLVDAGHDVFRAHSSWDGITVATNGNNACTTSCAGSTPWCVWSPRRFSRPGGAPRRLRSSGLEAAARTTSQATALRLSLAAHRIQPNGETRTNLINTLINSRYAHTLAGPYDEISVAFAPGEHANILAVGGSNPDDYTGQSPRHRAARQHPVPHPKPGGTGLRHRRTRVRPGGVGTPHPRNSLPGHLRHLTRRPAPRSRHGSATSAGALRARRGSLPLGQNDWWTGRFRPVHHDRFR